MEKVWDNSLSTLVNSNPQAFLDLMLPGARCLHHHRTKLSGTQRQPDAVLEVERFSKTFIYNPEFQSSQDTGMAERLLLYHMLLSLPEPEDPCALAMGMNGESFCGAWALVVPFCMTKSSLSFPI